MLKSKFFVYFLVFTVFIYRKMEKSIFERDRKMSSSKDSNKMLLLYKIIYFMILFWAYLHRSSLMQIYLQKVFSCYTEH